MMGSKRLGLAWGSRAALMPGLVLRLALPLLLIQALVSCRNLADWYPSGMVELATHYELESLGTKSLFATVRISNTGGSVISRSTFGLRATTDFSSYYTTLVSEVRILPGKAIWTTLVIPYAGPDEVLSEGGLTVENGFFE